MSQKQNLIRHLAIILDGNRSWAEEHGFPKFKGHTAGAKNIRPIVEAALKNKIPYLTLYTLSTENLKKRSPRELKHLFSLFEKLYEYEKLFAERGVRFQTIGNLRELPQKVQKVLTELQGKTAAYKNMTLTFALNYGGRDEIIRAIRKVKDSQALTEKTFEKYLDTAGIPDVDLLIRTGGYQRLSNFLPWQTTYAELYFTAKKWPEFTAADLAEAVKWFLDQRRKKGR